MKICAGCFRVAVLEISVFQVASNCKAEFEDCESCKRRDVENEPGSKRALEGVGMKP